MAVKCSAVDERSGTSRSGWPDVELILECRAVQLADGTAAQESVEELVSGGCCSGEKQQDENKVKCYVIVNDGTQ